MLNRLRRRWGILPTWIKVVPVAVLLVSLSWLHAHLPPEYPAWRHVLNSLFYLPLFMASLLFGLKGGLACAFLIGLNFLGQMPPEAEGVEKGRMMAWGLEVALYFVSGLITGVIADRERREAGRLKEAQDLALLGQAAAAVAHELKTPLVAIGGFAQRMLRDMPTEHPHHRPLGIIVDQVGHMEQLLREMLDYSRPVELNLSAQPLLLLVEECLAMLAHLAEQRQVRLETFNQPDLAVPLLDAGRVKQVVLNLVQNAIQASELGALVRVSISQRGPWVVLEVSDQGSGIRREDQGRVFFPFFTTKRQGTGLGLAISRKIAEAHGGRLEFDSQPGKGSNFRLLLPWQGPAAGEG
ncbi:MAG: HAMP domain-containing sensor histidine kinase [Pseudomonadota bacterium]